MAVAITTIANLEAALGRELSDAETPRATHYINVISAFIASYCDAISFQEIEDDVIRRQADYYGIIDIGGGPISSVDSVTDADGTEAGGWAFDGTDTIAGLAPFQTVDITLTHGTDSIPEDLVGLATEAVLGCVSLQVSGPLKTRTVGDVTYAFQDSQESVGVQLSKDILDRYCNQFYTIRTGPAGAFTQPYLPINWFQIGR
jgi:hypothetical protein